MKTMKVKEHRQIFNHHGTKLRRARHLFVLFCRHNIITTFGLKRIAQIMRDYGLYAPSTADKDIRYHILRKICKIEMGDTRHWHQWCRDKGWSFHRWENVKAA